MLTTNEDLRLSELSSLGGNDSATWRAVDLELWIPYVFITHSVEQDSVWITQTSIYWIEDDIVRFCRAFAGERARKITDIALLLPADNEKNRFGRRWVRVKEVWSYRNPMSMEDYPIYVSMERERIGGDWTETAQLSKWNAKLLYRAKRTI